MYEVNIADLKARLSEHLRQVRRGQVLTVLDRSTPVAQLVPYPEAAERLRVRHPRRRYATIQEVPLPAPLELDTDVVDLLLQERQAER